MRGYFKSVARRIFPLMGCLLYTSPKINKLSREEIIEHQKTHEFIVKYVDGLYEQGKQHFNIHNLSMLLIDEMCIRDSLPAATLLLPTV